MGAPFKPKAPLPYVPRHPCRRRTEGSEPRQFTLSSPLHDVILSIVILRAPTILIRD
jgi:hypothetical protein